jgi:flagellar export protein FliJ
MPADAHAEMKRFTFRLESVRRLREQEEQAVQAELAAAMAERAAVVTELARSRQAEEDLHAWLREGGRTAAEMAHVARYGELHRHAIFNLGVKLRQHDKGIELIRTRLVTARSRREALDRLRESQLAEHRREQLAEEQRELDEVGSMRAARRRSEVPGSTGAASRTRAPGGRSAA